MIGDDIRVDAQAELLAEIPDTYLREYHDIPVHPPHSPTKYTRATRFSGIYGALLYAMIRKLRTRRIIEVRSGYSSLLTLRNNAEENVDSCGEFTAIEPYLRVFFTASLKDSGRLQVEKLRTCLLQNSRSSKRTIFYLLTPAIR